LTLGVICECRPVNGDEEKEDDDKIRPVVKMRVKPSRTSDVSKFVVFMYYFVASGESVSIGMGDYSQVQCESKHPLRFSDIFSQTVGNS